MPAKKAKPTRYLAEERFAFSGGTVDRTDPNHPKIIGALLCGPESANDFVGLGRDRVKVKGRKYLAEAFKGERVKRYNGGLVYLNHPTKLTEPRDYRDKIAVVENARHRQDGMPLGDLAVNPKHPHAEQFLWDAEHEPHSFGMSHRAWCEWRTSKDGFAEAIELTEVLSVDVVTEPATTSGVFEHKEPKMSSTFAAVAEWVTKHSKSTAEQIIKVKKLAAIGNYAELAAEEMAADAEAGDGVTEAIKTAAAAEIEECMSQASSPEAVKSCLKRLKKILHLHGDLNEPEEEKEGEGKEEKKKEGAMEHKQIGFDKALSLCSEAKFSATPNEYRLLAKCETDAEVKAYIAEQTAKGGETKPRSSGRTTTNQPKAEPTQEQRTIPAWNRAASRN